MRLTKPETTLYNPCTSSHFANLLLSSGGAGGTSGLYSETYGYNTTTGNLASKGTVNYTTYDTNHKHAVTSSRTATRIRTMPTAT